MASQTPPPPQAENPIEPEDQKIVMTAFEVIVAAVKRHSPYLTNLNIEMNAQINRYDLKLDFEGAKDIAEAVKIRLNLEFPSKPVTAANCVNDDNNSAVITIMKSRFLNEELEDVD